MDDCIATDAPVRLISSIVDQLDLKPHIHFRYSSCHEDLYSMFCCSGMVCFFNLLADNYLSQKTCLPANNRNISGGCCAGGGWRGCKTLLFYYIANIPTFGSSFHSLPDKILPFSFLFRLTPSSPHVPHCLKKKATFCLAHCF